MGRGIAFVATAAASILLTPYPGLSQEATADEAARRRAALAVEAKAKAESAKAAAEAALESAAMALHKARQAGASDPAPTQFKGINFGIGISVSADFDGDILQEAEVIDDTVRVTEKKTALPRILLESHYFVATPKMAKLGIGPFVAIQAGGDEVIEAIGAGLMVGWRRTQRTVDEGNGKVRLDDSSFNIGIGLLLDNKANLLREGIRENHQAPANTQGNLTREASQWGFLLTFSFTP